MEIKALSILREGGGGVRGLKKNAALLALAMLTAVFSLGFFFGRRSVPYEISVQCAKSSAQEVSSQNSAPEEENRSETLPQASSQEGEMDIINLNTATKEELMTLPRVGEVLAERILAYRAQYGRFSAPEQLMDVEGIGEATFEALKALITVEDGT